MNPTPSDNQTTNNTNNFSEVPTQPAPNPSLPQLERETPMDITIYPSNENPENVSEPEKLTSNELDTAQPKIYENLTTSITDFNNVPASNELPNSESSPNPVLQNTISNEEPLKVVSENSNISTQKIAVIGGVLFGILIVAGVSIYYLSTLSKQTNTEKTQVGENQKPIVTQVEVQIPTKVELGIPEYKLRVDSIFTKYQNTISNNPINLNSNVPSFETIKFVSDEIFALAQEINELNLNPELNDVNIKLYNEMSTQVQSYDKLLKEYKTTNLISTQTKTAFLSETKASSDRINLLVNEIKNLK